MGSADGKWPRITLVERVCAVANQFRGDKEEVWTPIGGQDVLPLAIRSKVSHKDQDKVEEVRKTMFIYLHIRLIVFMHVCIFKHI
jgi:hypothetical protein